MIASLMTSQALRKNVPTVAGRAAELFDIQILSNTPQTTTGKRPTPSSRLKMEVLRGGEGLRKLADHWDKLLDQNAVRTPFMRWDWADVWWRHFEADYSAVFGVAWAEDDTVVALVPLVIGPGQTRARRQLRMLAFFAGLGEVVAEGLDFMVRPGHEASLVKLIDHVFEEIRDEWDMAHFGFADEQSPFYPLLWGALKKHGMDANVHNVQESPVIQLTHPCWESYLMERTANFRKKIRRHSNTARRDHQLSFSEPDAGDEVPDFVEHLIMLHGKRWSREESLFLRPRSVAFHHEFAKRGFANGRVVLLLMEFSNQPVAANYAFIEGDRMWDYQGGWDVKHRQCGPAKLVNAENVKRAMERGVREIDMLPGDIEYKKKWTQACRQVADLEAINPNSLRARVFLSIRTVKRALTLTMPVRKETS